MERAGRILSKLKLPRDVYDAEQLARAAWPVAVGKTIAAHTRVRGLVRSTLVIEVEDMVWQRNLAGLSRMIAANVNRLLGRAVVEDIDFRKMPPRREPQRAETARPVRDDEADSIEDPVLRRVFLNSRNLNSRKRSSA